MLSLIISACVTSLCNPHVFCDAAAGRTLMGLLVQNQLKDIHTNQSKYLRQYPLIISSLLNRQNTSGYGDNDIKYLREIIARWVLSKPRQVFELELFDLRVERLYITAEHDKVNANKEILFLSHKLKDVLVNKHLGGNNDKQAKSAPNLDIMHLDMQRYFHREIGSRLSIAANTSPQLVLTDNLCLKSDGDYSDSFFLSTGSILSKKQHRQWGSILIAGNNSSCGELTDSIIVVDGDLVLSPAQTWDKNSLIIATGNITSESSITALNCTLLSGGSITAKKPSVTSGSRLYAKSKIEIIPGRFGNAKPLGDHHEECNEVDFGIKYFSLNDLGLQMKKLADFDTVQNVNQDSKLRNHLRAGDLLLEINGTIITGQEQLRKEFRSALCVRWATVKLCRNDKYIIAIIPL